MRLEGIRDNVITHDIMTAGSRYACTLCSSKLHRNRTTLQVLNILLLSITSIMDMHLPTCESKSQRITLRVDNVLKNTWQKGMKDFSML